MKVKVNQELTTYATRLKMVPVIVVRIADFVIMAQLQQEGEQREGIQETTLIVVVEIITEVVDHTVDE